MGNLTLRGSPYYEWRNTQIELRTASLSSRWVCLSKNLVLQYILESLSSLLFHSLMSEWIADHFCWPFLSRLFPTNQNKAGQKRREEKCGGKQCAKKLVSNFHSLISEWKRRDDKLSSIYWRTRFLLRHTQPDDRLVPNNFFTNESQVDHTDLILIHWVDVNSKSFIWMF